LIGCEDIYTSTNPTSRDSKPTSACSAPVITPFPTLLPQEISKYSFPDVGYLSIPNYRAIRIDPRAFKYPECEHADPKTPHHTGRGCGRLEGNIVHEMMHLGRGHTELRAIIPVDNFLTADEAFGDERLMYSCQLSCFDNETPPCEGSTHWKPLLWAAGNCK
jgi:hypothetical protein